MKPTPILPRTALHRPEGDPPRWRSPGESPTTRSAAQQWQDHALESVAHRLFSHHFRQQQLRVHVAGSAGSEGGEEDDVGEASLGGRRRPRRAAEFPLVLNDKPMLASVPLHLLLRFTSCAYPCWSAAMVYVTLAKLATPGTTAMNEFYRFALQFNLAVFILAEPVRLLLGMRGNRRERIPDLAGFLLLSVLPQVLVLAYFAVLQRVHAHSVVSPVEVALNAAYLAVLVPQVAIGYRVVDRIFHVMSLPLPPPPPAQRGPEP
ncbi:hypothetical protein H9P43_007780 [Blastocladiella emersonii ATCC 22665]|nr:hypothetical protein H9P43_007780 [Blastocladiella emersonii ATCC 22665]